ncbi:MAG: TetR/AcrR family transcriptional regulator [Candidatus Marinimicrobia bacterium]|nr:TetR/AcrR family transcriptional regulator [Candidatus Neomarinimicrobiota bacterium]
MSPEEKKRTEEIIIGVAEKVFIRDGFSGTRMQTIADEAGLNKALLHYYYRSKQKLFYAVLKRLAPKLFAPVLGVLYEELPFFEKIEKFVHRYIDEISQKNPNLPLFVISEMEKNADDIIPILVRAIDSREISPIEIFRRDMEREIKAGNLREMDHKQLFVSILSMAIFPFVGRPLIMQLARFQNHEYDLFIQERKKFIVEFVINSIKIQKTGVE